MEKSLKSKIVAVALTVLMGLCAAFAVFFMPVIQTARGAGSGLRFSQVALGENFAIALSYDKELYGWNLSGSGNNSLGVNYGSDPVKIEVPSLAADDEIVKIAATRASAAFITKKNRIYTWGTNSLAGSGNIGMLLRSGDNLTTPQPIATTHSDFTVIDAMQVNGALSYPNNASLDGSQIVGEDNQLIDIVGSDNNYIIKHIRRNNTGNIVAYFGWGSNKYMTTGSTASSDSLAVNMYGFFETSGETNDNPNFAVGGNTALIANGNNIYIRGKNYYIPTLPAGAKYEYETGKTNITQSQGVPESDTYGVLYFDNVFDLSTNDNSQNVGSGDNSRYTITQSQLYLPYDNNGDKIDGVTSTAGYLVNEAFAGKALEGSDSYDFFPVEKANLDDLQLGYSTASFKNGPENVKLPAVSLGNGYGYFIHGDALYFFGNGYNGQSGTSNAKAYKSITEISGYTGVPVTVAAGKTSLGKALFVNPRTATALSDTGVLHLQNTEGSKFELSSTAEDPAFSKFADGDVFMSGMLTSIESGSSYKVYVWNKDKTFTDIDELLASKGVTGTPENHIAQLFAGYGNNMVALSTLGKIYQIGYDASGTESRFTVDLKDKFKNSTGGQVTDIVNYTVNDSRLSFLVSNGRPSDDSQQQSKAVKATLTLNALTSSDGALDVSAEFKPIVSDNAGDKYRILTNEDGEGDVSDHLKARTIASDKLVNRVSEDVPDTGAPVFYFESRTGDTSSLSEAILSHYLDYKFTYDAQGNVSLEITPYQSTQGGAIIMEYYVARCMGDEALVQSMPSSHGGMNGKILDVAVARARISIANTKADFKEFSNVLDVDMPDGKSPNISVPVLDPNNPKNNVYSIAITNSQYGLTMLARKFGLGGDAAALRSFNEKVVKLAYEYDQGFPASQRVEDAKLSRYYDDAGDDLNFKSSSYYTDKYQYVAFDPDGDKLSFDRSSFRIYNSANTYFSNRVQTISFDIPLSDTGYALQDLSKETLSEFNNIYGLTLDVVGESGSEVLNVKYDVLQVVAVKSSSYIEYQDNDIRHALIPRTDSIPEISLAVKETYYIGNAENTNSNIDDRDGAIYLPVYVQASMIMTAENYEYYSAEGHNVYHVPTKALRVGSSDDASRIFTFDLTNEALFADSTNIYMSFAKTNTTGETSYRNFSDFVGQFDSGNVSVTLDETRFTFESKVAETYEDIQIELRRFTNSNMRNPIKTVDSSGRTVDAEVITLVFDIRAAASAFVTDAIETLKPQTINKETEIAVSEFINTRDTYFVYSSSSNDNIATVARSSSGDRLIITPKASGKVTVTFTLQQYNATKKGSFIVNVESRSVLDKEISLVETSEIFLADFKGAIAQNADSFDFNKFVLDTRSDQANAPNGFYFVEKKPAEDGSSSWETVSRPEFISEVSVRKVKEEDNSILLRLNSDYKSSGSESDVMLVVKFTDDINSDDARRFEAAVAVSAGKRYLADSGSDLEVVVNKINKLVQVPEGGFGESSNEGKQLRLSLSEIIKYAGVSGNPNDYNIQLAVPELSSSFDYFDMYSSGNDIIIVPYKNTAEKQQINVVISDTNLNYVLTFYVSVTGIVEVLSTNTYVIIWIVVAACVLVILFIIFMIRMGIYWKRKAEQKRIIRKNQMLIKMRDKMHGKSEGVSKEQLVQTKLKLEDPKYAKMFSDMKRASEEEGITLDGGSKKSKGKKDKKNKKSGKKSLAELKAELEAKREAVAKMQMGGEVPMDDIPVDSAYGAPIDPDFGAFESVVPEDVVAQDPMNGTISPDDNVLFDVETLDDDK